MTLIHLVSEQTMQNLLPLIALRPARVIQIRSADDRFAEISRHLEAAARECGSNAEFTIEILDQSSPGIDAVRHVLKQNLAIFPSAAVNITGGTKLMSLGAYLGAGEFPSVPILYCDTPNQRFQAVGRDPLPADLPAFPEVAASLTLRIVMAAHGKSPDAWRFDAATPAELDFGHRAWDLRTADPEPFQRFGPQVRAFYRNDKGRIPSGIDKLKALAEADLTDALAGDLPEPVARFLQAAADAGLLAPTPQGGCRLSPGPETKRALRAHLEKTANLLDGSWLELAVLAFLTRSSRHLDPHWSVEPSGEGRENAEYGETDLIAVDAERAALEIISCKTEVRQPLEHLEGLRTRADNLGGSHARATLAVLRAGDPNAERRLRQWGKLLRVNVLVGPEIPEHFPSPPS